MEHSLSETSTRTPSPTAAPTLASETATFVSAHSTSEKPVGTTSKGIRFYLLFASICSSIFLSALDLTSVSTALPQIAADFNTSDYSWIASSYTLASTAVIPWSASLAHIFGRRKVMVSAIAIFALGSALTGAAQNVPMLIAGRTVQGIGGGCVQTMCNIIVVDLVPIAERGTWFGLLAAVWALSSAIGPPVGGALSSAGQWRWLFYLNLPICGIAMGLVILFLRVKSPELSAREKLRRMDWLNILFIASATSSILGLTWGGVAYSWSSYHTLVPLILGIAGIVFFAYLERFASHPTIPYAILAHRNAIIGNVLCFLHSIVVIAVLYYYPIYLQSVVGDSAIQSGVHTFNLSFTIAPLAIISGLLVNKTGHYKLQITTGWALMLIGLALMTLLRGDSSKGAWIGFPILVGIGAGILYSSTNFSVLAPLRPSEQPYGSAFYALTRAFGQVVGISAGSTTLQNRLSKTLPVGFASKFQGGEIAFAAIPYIKNLEEPLRSQVRNAFANSIRTIWIFTAGITGAAVLLSLLIKNLPLTKEKDETFGLNEPLREKEKKVSSTV